MKIIILERHTGFLRILISLYEKENQRSEELRNNTGLNRDTFYRIYPKLIELGFIQTTAEIGKEKKFIHGLTEKGRKIAKHLYEIEKIL
jgi:DNA-binding MarR family transcriptional regulator